jgi:hypothetical protein
MKRLVYNYLDTGTTVMTGILKTTVTGGPTLRLDNMVKDQTLSALVSVDAETDTITIEAIWEVSNDAVTWVVAPTLNNAATVVLATGTAGADALVTKVISAPSGVYGFRYARLSVINRVADGLIADTYRIGYNFEKADEIA